MRVGSGEVDRTCWGTSAGIEDTDLPRAGTGDVGFASGEDDISGLIADEQIFHHGSSAQAEDGDAVSDFIDDPKLIIRSRADTSRLKADGNLTEPHRCAAAEIKNGDTSIRGIDCDQPRAIQRHRQRMHLTPFKVLVGRRGAAGDKEAKKESAHGFSG